MQLMVYLIGLDVQAAGMHLYTFELEVGELGEQKSNRKLWCFFCLIYDNLNGGLQKKWSVKKLGVFPSNE